MVSAQESQLENFDDHIAIITPKPEHTRWKKWIKD
jgi:hypothetical protein